MRQTGERTHARMQTIQFQNLEAWKACNCITDGNISAHGCFCRKQKMTCGRPPTSLKHIFSAIYFKIRLAVSFERIFPLSQASTCLISLPNSNNLTKPILQEQKHQQSFGYSEFCVTFAVYLSNTGLRVFCGTPGAAVLHLGPTRARLQLQIHFWL